LSNVLLLTYRQVKRVLVVKYSRLYGGPQRSESNEQTKSVHAIPRGQDRSYNASVKLSRILVAGLVREAITTKTEVAQR
jgi:hypothetical protein